MNMRNITKRVTLQSVIAGVVFVATTAGFDWKDWSPTNPHDFIKVAAIFILGLIVAFLGINVQSPSSQAFVLDALKIFNQALAQHQTVLKPEIRSAMYDKLAQAKPEELRAAGILEEHGPDTSSKPN